MMGNKRQFQGVWIPAEVWLDKDLKPIEKLFFVEIQSLDDPEKGCWASNEYFSDFFDLSKGRCTQIIKSLEKKGLVEVTLNRKGKQIVSRQIKVVRKLNRVVRKLNNPIKNIKQPYLENDEENNTGFNNTKSNKKESPKKSPIEFLQFGEKVKLPKSAYEKLVSEFGELKIIETVEKINTWLTTSENGIKRGDYKNYSQAIRNWMTRDEQPFDSNSSNETSVKKIPTWREKVEILSKGDKGSDWQGQAGEDNREWANRVCSWLKFGLDKHWDISAQDWIMNTPAQKQIVLDLHAKARSFRQGRVVA